MKIRRPQLDRLFMENLKIFEKELRDNFLKNIFESGRDRFELFTNTLINVGKHFNKTILFERRLKGERG